MPKTAFTQADVDTWNRADKHQITVNTRDIAAQRDKMRRMVQEKGLKPGTAEYAELVDPILLDIGATEWLNTRISERIAKRVPSGKKPSTENPFRKS